MARHRKTLALIIICLPILATVITAFRVRDLPKTLQDSLKSELKKHKCDDCDVDDVKDKHSLKTESATKRYEELKKAVREKQHELHQKVPAKASSKFIDDSADDDDDDDDDELEFLKSESGLKNEDHSKVAKTKKDGKLSNIISSFTYDDDDDDDDDDEEDDDDVRSISTKIPKSTDQKDKIQSAKIPITKKSIGKSINVKDDDDDDDNNIEDIKFKSKKIEATTPKKSKESLTKQTQKTANKDDRENIKNKKGIPKQKLDSQQKVKDSKTKEQFKKVKSDEDDDDEDDDDYDDDENDDERKTITKNLEPKKKVEVKESLQKTKPEDKDDDNDDDDDADDDDFFDDLKKIAMQKPVKESSKSKKATPVQDHKKEKSKSDTKSNTKEDQNQKKPVPVKKDIPKSVSKEDEKKSSDKLKASKEEKTVDSVKKVKEEKDTKPKNNKLKADSKEIEGKRKASEIKKDHKKEKSSTETVFDYHEMYSNRPYDDQLKHVTDALYRRNLLVSEFEDFYAFFPTFAPNFSRIHNPECRRHGQILLRQLRGTKLWALNMLDATAKIPSGILQGNTIQLGDFDQCLNSRAKVQLDTGSVVKVQGQYCLATLDVKAEHEELEVPVHLALAKNLIKSRIEDPGHFVPRFSTLSWGVCVPAACDPQDVEVVIKDAIKHYQHRSGFVLKVKVDEDDCHTQEADWWEDWLQLPTILTLSFYGIILLLVLIATIRDFFARRKTEGDGADQAEELKDAPEEGQEEQPDKSKTSGGVLSSFSLYHSVAKLTAAGSDEEICCIHGVRGLSTLALLVAHKFLPVAVMPYTNRLKITEIVSSPLWSWARAGWMYTDCFLLLSGALTAHRMSNGEAGAPWRLFTRYLRLTPALLAVVLFYAYVWDLVSEGPMWGTLVTKNVQICEESWWWNLLYVHNWFGFEEMCAPQTHQLALDMQLTILGGVIVWVLQFQHWAVRLLLPGLHAAAAYSRYTTVRDHRLTLVAYHGVTVSQLYRTARLTYTSVFHRSTPYLVGLSLGLMLKKPAQHGMVVSIIGWVTSIMLWGAVWWAGLDSGSTSYRYNAAFASQYAAFAPIASALAIAWVIYAVHNSSGFLSSLLCCRALVFVSRLSYALYLCQFVVFLTNAATVRTATEFTLMSLIDVQEISAILISSTILTLTMVIPMQSLHKLFDFPSKAETDEDNKDCEEQNVKAERVEEQEDEKEVGRNHVEEIIEVPQIRSRQSLLAHREILEEIPEVEVEYEAQRDKMEGLEEILEEEEDGEEMANHIDDDDLEIIDEEEAEGGEDFWSEREEYTPRRIYAREDDTEEWEWTSNGGRGAQHYRYSR